MIENQSMSKKEKLDSQSGVDLLSDLPLGIVHVILARVPIRDAIRTSVLSRQWRHTWASLSSLVFDKKCVSREGKSQSEFEECVKNIITHVLFHHKGPIHRFDMSVFFAISCPDFDEWILHLSRNDIKELILHRGNPDFHESQPVHSSIYSCEKLTTLELDNCYMDPPPSTFKGFLFLRYLYLEDVDMSSDGIESLVTNSPLLERFELSNLIVPGNSELRISAPNLKYVYLLGRYTEICMYAPLLSDLTAQFSYSRLFTDEFPQQKGSVCNYTNFFCGFTNLEKLCGQCDFIKYVSIGIEFCHRTLVFHHLKDIELNDVNFEDKKEILTVTRLITCAPNLHTLKISTNLDSGEKDDVASDSESPELCLSDFGCKLGFTFEKLRFVRIDDVSGFPSVVDFMEFLLESSPVLESMTIFRVSFLGTEEKERLSNELLACRRASPNAKVLVHSG